MTAERFTHLPRDRRLRVLIAGGGIAGVETLLALRAVAGDRVSIELIAPSPDLVVRPLAVAAPFGTEEVRRFDLRAICAEHHARFRHDALSYVDVVAHRVETERFATLEYDVLVVASGARRRPALEGTVTFDGPSGVVALRRTLEELRAGSLHNVVFAVPDGVTWPLPLYELAIMTAGVAAEADTGATITLVTPEVDPLGIFGPPAAAKVRELLEHSGVLLRSRAHPFGVAMGTLLTTDGAMAAQRIFTLPVLDGPRVPGLPLDAAGFLPVDEHGAIRGVEDVYAAGDGTDHPVKQGGLAAQQADAVADAIGARLGLVHDPAPFRPVLRAQLLTGALPWYFRAAEGPDAGDAALAPLAAQAPLWWPPAKIAARHLGPYLATHAEPALGGRALLHDRDGTSEFTVDAAQRDAAREVALVFADEDAEAGDTRSALRWLDAAESAYGLLPPGYVEKRRRWTAELELARS